MDVPKRAPLRLPHDHFHSLGVSLMHLFHLRQHFDAGIQGIFVHLEFHVPLFCLLRLFSA